MALNDSIPKSVTFVIGWRKESGASRKQIPIGTGFLVGVRPPIGTPMTRAFTVYVVTAAHVVQAESESWIRLRRISGELEDIPVTDWIFHDRDDVAIAPLELDETHDHFDIALLPIPDFLPRSFDWRHGERTDAFRPMLGDPVYFVGLFSPVPSLSEKNVPLVRSGTLAAIAQPDIPVRRPDNSVAHFTAHLVDCRSYSGLSPATTKGPPLRHE